MRQFLYYSYNEPRDTFDRNLAGSTGRRRAPVELAENFIGQEILASSLLETLKFDWNRLKRSLTK